MNRPKIVSSTLKVTASEDLDLGPMQESVNQKSIAELIDEQEKNQKEKDKQEEEDNEENSEDTTQAKEESS
mgnify:CR=1 FL=1|tara:strand:- start:1033 stop:1245 length:213 start_codon:yes stop_codon:yes gene_type:complete